MTIGKFLERVKRTISDEPMVFKVVNKINRKLKVIFRKKDFEYQKLRKMLYSGVIQAHY